MVCRVFAARLCVLVLEQEGIEREVILESRGRAWEYAAAYLDNETS